MIAHTPETGQGAGWDGIPAPRAEDIVQHVERGARGRIYDLQVECDEGRLVLRGWCRTYYAKQLAQQAALEMAASPTLVVNQISIV